MTGEVTTNEFARSALWPSKQRQTPWQENTKDPLFTWPHFHKKLSKSHVQGSGRSTHNAPFWPLSLERCGTACYKIKSTKSTCDTRRSCMYDRPLLLYFHLPSQSRHKEPWQIKIWAHPTYSSTFSIISISKNGWIIHRLQCSDSLNWGCENKMIVGNQTQTSTRTTVPFDNLSFVFAFWETHVLIQTKWNEHVNTKYNWAGRVWYWRRCKIGSEETSFKNTYRLFRNARPLVFPATSMPTISSYKQQHKCDVIEIRWHKRHKVTHIAELG